MLEDILKSINSNLEKIANSLGSNDDKLSCECHLDAEKLIAKVEPVNVKEPVVNQPVCDPVQQVTISQQPIQQAAPVIRQPVQQMPQAMPISNIQQSFTQEQLAVAMSNAVSAGKMGIIQNILQQLNVQALTQVNPADYNKLATMLQEAGVKV